MGPSRSPGGRGLWAPQKKDGKGGIITFVCPGAVTPKGLTQGGLAADRPRGAPPGGPAAGSTDIYRLGVLGAGGEGGLGWPDG